MALQLARAPAVATGPAAPEAACELGGVDAASNATSSTYFLETAGLSPQLRDAALERRRHTFALIWVGAYAPADAGVYGIAVTFHRSGEHIAGSPYLVHVT